VLKVKVKWSRYRPGVTQRVGRGMALLFHDRSTRRGWVLSSMPQPHFTPRKDPVTILQEVGWTPGLVWTGGKSHPHWDLIPDRPAHSQSLYWLSYLAHKSCVRLQNFIYISHWLLTTQRRCITWKTINTIKQKSLITVQGTYQLLHVSEPKYPLQGV